MQNTIGLHEPRSRVAASLPGPDDPCLVPTSLQHADLASSAWWMACDGGSLPAL